MLTVLCCRGFSFVYLAEDQSGRLFAMKKIRCTFGTETVDEALKEVEMYKKFPHRNIIKVLVRISERNPSQCLDRTNTIW